MSDNPDDSRVVAQSTPPQLFKPEFIKPRYLGLWLLLGFLRCIVFLPHALRIAIGRLLAYPLYALAGERRRVAERNIALCFPELDPSARKNILKEHFKSLGIAVVEQGIAWFESDENLKRISRIEGMEHIKQIQQQGGRIILLSAHFTSLEIGNRLFMVLSNLPLYAMYQRHKYPGRENIIQYYRRRNGVNMIPENEIRTLVKSIKQGKIVWYASDQGYSDQNAVMAPFFTIPASSNTALTRLATVSKASVIPFFTIREPNTNHYVLKLLAPLQHYPSGNDIEDITRYHQLIEEQARQTPEQYLWVHKRFKNRPPEYPDVYKKS